MSLKSSILIIFLIIALFFFIFGLFRKSKRFFWLAGLSLFILVGSLYCVYDDLKFHKSVNIEFDKKILFSGTVINNPVIKNTNQEFVLKLSKPQSGRVLVKTAPYPRFNYGDNLQIKGKIQKPSTIGYARYLEKEKISGTVSFSEINVLSRNNGSVFKAWLFNIKNKITESFQKVLGVKEAAFLNGLTLGGTSGLTDAFKKAMSLSGTTHLVALSGYNITILVWVVMGVFIYFLPRRLSFILTFLAIIAFVAMTGAESSVVRAGIMGMLVLLAREVGRVYDFRNAIILAALAMVLINPKVLVFDIGFELSFLALLGIVYLRPALIKLFKIKENISFLSWRDNLFTTASAQLAVVPILISNFGNFSPTSLISNVLILEFVPFTMAFGFFIAASSFVSYHLALIFGWIVMILLKFEIFVIELFARISVPISLNLSLFVVVLYYLFLIGFVFYVQRNNRKN
ncbi:MAG: ComEC/Rec2 family competence protein [Patescibacteria group bacterium]|nr:ComEC/Rec2 family competence protein [Patescibacteria group bacterium]